MADTNPSALHSTAKAEFACPDCGEMVREGLVRCWNCGGFLRPEMEKQFQKMQRQPTEVILSDSFSPAADDKDLDTMMQVRESDADQSEDFRISTPVKRVDAPKIEGAEAPPAETPSATGGETPEQPRESAGSDADVPHSIATGGDALLQLAAAEELEQLRRQGNKATGIDGVKAIRDGFLIDAPKGCRIQVRDERTGEMRRLTFGASSRVRISMLDKLEKIAKAKKEAAEKEPAGPKHVTAGKYQRWMTDIHKHTINPAKLKLVADGLTKDFASVDLGFAEDGLIVVSLPVAKKSMFGGSKGPSTATSARDALLEYLRAGKSLEGTDVAVVGDVNLHYSSDKVAEMRVVQPAASLSDSLFAGIPVFGTGRIAVQMPLKEAGEQPKVLSFTLSQFREFVEIVGPLFSMTEFGHNLGIPLIDTFAEFKCHYSGAAFKALEHLEFYQTDPTLETVLAGWKCEACGIAVSEDSRNKEKLGGKGGKGMAKAKCPKCEKKMGNVPLYTLASLAKEPQMQEDESSEAAEDEKAVEDPAKAEA